MERGLGVRGEGWLLKLWFLHLELWHTLDLNCTKMNVATYIMGC